MRTGENGSHPLYAMIGRLSSGHRVEMPSPIGLRSNFASGLGLEPGRRERNLDRREEGRKNVEREGVGEKKWIWKSCADAGSAGVTIIVGGAPFSGTGGPRTKF
jgi:hypothetical protein